MRRNEITPELIELSKKAKELGFPQDFEQGDWIYCECKDIEDYPHGLGLENVWSEHPDIDSDIWKKSDTDWLILSFSRCLEWLNNRKSKSIAELYRNGSWDTPLSKRTYCCRVYFWNRQISEHAKTHHEAIAKAVCKIMEGG